MTKSAFSERYTRLRHLLIEARNKSGLTQLDLALKLERPQSFVSKVERGERKLDLVEFLDFAAALDLNVTDTISDIASIVETARLRPGRA